MNRDLLTSRTAAILGFGLLLAISVIVVVVAGTRAEKKGVRVFPRA